MRTKVQPYFRPVEKKSLAEPDDFFHHKCNGNAARCHAVSRIYPTGGRPAGPKPARLTNRSECTCDARARIAYTSDAW